VPTQDSSPRSRLSLAQRSLPTTTFKEDITLAVDAGIAALLVEEEKLVPGREADVLSQMHDAGLAVGGVIPRTVAILPSPPSFGGSENPQDRIEDLCRSMQRLGPLQPASFLVVTGRVGDLDEAEARRLVIQGLRTICRVGMDYGVTVVLEPMRADAPVKTSFVHTLLETRDVILEVSADNLGICLDVFHIWNVPGILDQVESFAAEVSSVHISDRRQTPRGNQDRLLPGDGVVDLTGLIGKLEAGGYRGWYHLLVASDVKFDDSPWRLEPKVFIRRGVEGFEAALQRIGD